MNNLMPDEEARLNGRAYASIGILGTPQPGDTVVVVISGGGLDNDETLTAVMPALSGDVNRDQLVMTQQLVLSAVADQNLTDALFLAVAPYGTGPFAGRLYPNPLFVLTCPKAFTIAVTAPATTAAQARSQGKPIPPFFIQNEGTPNQTTLYGYLNILDQLEAGQASTTENLDTSRADVWVARPTEIKEREKLYNLWRGKTAMFMGIPLGETVYSQMAKMKQRHLMGIV